jgi:hypothetical protein
MVLKVVIASLWPVTSAGFSSVGSSQVLVGDEADVRARRNHVRL